MKSKNHSYVPELDQLRGAAALLVFFYHSVHRGLVQIGSPDWPIASNPLSALIIEGHTGVALFMVLSGYVLARGTFGKDIIYSEFLRNRVLRIFPLMTVVVMIGIASIPKIEFGQIASWFLLMGNTTAAAHDNAGVVSALWTVAVEFQFYLVAPFLFMRTGRQGIIRFLLPMALFFIFMRLLVIVGAPSDFSEHYRFSYFTIAGRINQFLIGIGLAYLCDTYFPRQDRLTSIAILVCSSAAALAFVFILNKQGGITVWRPWHLVLPEIEATIWAAVLFGYISVKPLGRLGSILAKVGTISFGIYVLHYAIQLNWWLHLYPRTGLHINASWQLYLISVGVLIPVLILSAISWKCIEEPFNDMRKKYIRLPRAKLSPEPVLGGSKRIQSSLASSEEIELD